jgi:hypothetical protein
MSEVGRKLFARGFQPSDTGAATSEASTGYVARGFELSSNATPILGGFEMFCGATIQLFQVEVLVVLVAPRLLGDRIEAPLVVAAFQAKFKRTIVLAAQDSRGVPTFFGPGPIAAVLARIPFDALAWKQYRFSRPPPQMLPIPVDPLPEERSGYASSIANASLRSASGSFPSPSVDGGLAIGRRTLAFDEDGGATRR